MAATTLHNCLYCTHNFEGNFCPQCGEKVYKESDKKVWRLLSEGLHVVTHFEGTFFTTIRYLFTRPGKISELYCAGIRKSLFKPVSLFFLLIILYLLFPLFDGLNMRLYYHTHHGTYGDYAMQKASELMKHRGWTDAQINEAFHAKSEKISKFFLLLLLPLTALFFWAFTYKKRRYFFDQMIFATEVNSMYLIWGFMILPLLLIMIQLINKSISGSMLSFADDGISIVLYIFLLTFVAIGCKRFYKVKWWQAAGIALLFYVAHTIIVQIIYKFLLFNATMWAL